MALATTKTESSTEVLCINDTPLYTGEDLERYAMDVQDLLNDMRKRGITAEDFEVSVVDVDLIIPG